MNESRRPGVSEQGWRKSGKGHGQRPLVLAANVTPFEGESIDWTGVEENLRFQDAFGLDGVLVAGTTGEREHLSAEERDRLITTALAALAPSMLLVAGVVTLSTDPSAAAEDAARAVEAGADAILLAPPTSHDDPARDDGKLNAWVSAVVAGADKPVIFYHPPAYRDAPLADEVIREIAALDGLRGVKESLGDERLVDLWLEAAPDELGVFVGSATIFPSVAARVAGGILALATVHPQVFATMARRAMNGQSMADLEHEIARDAAAFKARGVAALKDMHENLGLFGGEMRRT